MNFGSIHALLYFFFTKGTALLLRVLKRKWVPFHGGEREIRTLDRLLTYTRVPGVRLQPLGHLSGIHG